MDKTIFISHAGIDAEPARRVARLLSDDGHRPLMDRDELELGDSFLNFMEESLASADYCLLLWSRAAAESRWVRAEWEAALHRGVEEARTFLLLGRLDPHPPPRLLSPRLWARLFPELHPGIDDVRKLLLADRAAEDASDRPVARARPEPSDAPEAGNDPGGALVGPQPAADELYVTSELFGRTVPVKARLDAPTGLLLDALVEAWRLPRQLDVQGRVGLRLNYALRAGEARLERDLSLAGQGVAAGAVLRLETEVRPFSEADPHAGTLRPLVFRAIEQCHPDEADAATLALRRAVTAAGLGPVLPRL